MLLLISFTNCSGIFHFNFKTISLLLIQHKNLQNDKFWKISINVNFFSKISHILGIFRCLSKQNWLLLLFSPCVFQINNLASSAYEIEATAFFAEFKKITIVSKFAQKYDIGPSFTLNKEADYRNDFFGKMTKLTSN